jgi:DNA-binding NarL/FixJ family response regulator
MNATVSPGATRVVIADDHRLVRRAVSMLLERAGMNVVGQAEHGEEAVALAETLAPDVLVLDVAMPRLDGVSAVRRLRAQRINVPVVMLSMFKQDSLVQRSLDAGASGYVFKGDTTNDLVRAIELALEGRSFVSGALQEAGIEAPGDEAQGGAR